MGKKPPQKMPGPPSTFRGKVRAPVSVQLTPDNHEVLASNLARLSTATGRRRIRSDYFNVLVKRFGHKVTPDMLSV